MKPQSCQLLNTDKNVTFPSAQCPAPAVQHMLFSQVMVPLVPQCPGWIQSMKQLVAGLYEAVFEEGALSVPAAAAAAVAPNSW